MSHGLRWHCETRDQTRATCGQDYVYQDGDVLIATDFECGNGRNIRRVGRDRYAVDLEPEPGEHQFSGQSYYFCFGVRNKRPGTHAVVIELRNQGLPQWTDQTQHVVTRQGDAWGHVPREHIRNPGSTPPRLDLHLDLPGADATDPVVFCSNFHWYPYTDLTRDLRALAEVHADIELSSVGTSFFGRALPCAEVGPPDAPGIVLSQTPQPSEMGQHTCLAVLRWLVSDDPSAQKARSEHRVSVLPSTNPDGTVLGYGVSDGQGRFPYFEAHLAVSEADSATPETVAVWRHLASARPWLFIEFHSNNWSRRPGHMLLRYDHDLIDDADRRRLWDAWEERLLGLPHTHHGNWTGREHGLYQQSMGFAAATQLGSIACMIKHHDKYPLDETLAHAVASFRAAIDR